MAVKDAIFSIVLLEAELLIYVGVTTLGHKDFKFLVSTEVDIGLWIWNILPNPKRGPFYVKENFLSQILMKLKI